MRMIAISELDNLLTEGKTYECTPSLYGLYNVRCDDGNEWNLHPNRFATIEEMREMKLKDLGI